jgi:hypothetical protein
MSVVPFPSSNRLDQIADEIRTTWARAERDIEATRALLIEAQAECRRQGLSWSKWCRTHREQLGIGKRQIENIIAGFTSSHRPAHRVHNNEGCYPDVPSFAWGDEVLVDGSRILFSRSCAMPSPDTFTIAPIAAFVRRHLAASTTTAACGVSIDPFARNCPWATHRNDLSPDTKAQFHLDAEDFLVRMREEGVVAAVGIFDPPYSARQISEVYQGIGHEVGQNDTQSGALYRRVRDALDALIEPGGIVLSFGWNSSGMGIGRGYAVEEVLIVAHGAGHNDTICIACSGPGSLDTSLG